MRTHGGIIASWLIPKERDIVCIWLLECLSLDNGREIMLFLISWYDYPVQIHSFSVNIDKSPK